MENLISNDDNISNLESLSCKHIRNILVYLTIRETSSLACTSKALMELVNLYWKELCTTDGFQESFRFITKHQFELKERLNGLHSILTSGEYSHRWLYTQIVKFKTYKQSVAKVTSFAHLGKLENIVRCWDEQLKRNVVILKKIVWLHFFHKFIGVLPGRYQVILRMAVNSVNFSTNKEPATIGVAWQEKNRSNEVKAEILYHQWLQLQQSFRRKIKGKVVRLKGAKTRHFDAKTDFFDFYLIKTICISEKCDVTFEYKDIDNPGFKTGMKWDYIELRPVIDLF